VIEAVDGPIRGEAPLLQEGAGLDRKLEALVAKAME